MTTAKPACEICPTRESGIFCDITKDDLREFSRARSFNTYKRKSIIFYEGNPPLGLFCVQKGKVKISKHGSDGQVQIVRLAGPGDILGYRALFAGEPYAATAEVLEDASLCFVDKVSVYALLKKNAALALSILERVCQDLRVSEDAVLDLVQRPVSERVANMLLNLQETYGTRSPDGIHLDITLTREEMAEMVGTTAETLIRTLSDFKTRGLVALEPPHAIIIKKPAELARMAPERN